MLVTVFEFHRLKAQAAISAGDYESHMAHGRAMHAYADAVKRATGTDPRETLLDNFFALLDA